MFGQMSEPADLDKLLAREGLTKVELSRETGLSLTTIWRAAFGRPVTAISAAKLKARFPQLSFERLTLGDPRARQ